MSDRNSGEKTLLSAALSSGGILESIVEDDQRRPYCGEGSYWRLSSDRTSTHLAPPLPLLPHENQLQTTQDSVCLEVRKEDSRPPRATPWWDNPGDCE